jgi:hypothetical protein
MAEIKYYNGNTKKWTREPNSKEGCSYTAYDVPTDEEIKYFVETEWASEVVSENAIDKLFLETYPKNIDVSEVFAKVSLLNDVYSTQLSNKDKTLISEMIVSYSPEFDVILSRTERDSGYLNSVCQSAKEKTGRYSYSFMTKYFSHHSPKYYPIYDDYVNVMLKWYRDHTNVGFSFKDRDLNKKDYKLFSVIIDDFKSKFGIDSSIKQIDQFLWTAGKIFFKRYE